MKELYDFLKGDRIFKVKEGKINEQPVETPAVAEPSAPNEAPQVVGPAPAETPAVAPASGHQVTKGNKPAQVPKPTPDIPDKEYLGVKGQDKHFYLVHKKNEAGEVIDLQVTDVDDKIIASAVEKGLDIHNEKDFLRIAAQEIGLDMIAYDLTMKYDLLGLKKEEETPVQPPTAPMAQQPAPKEQAPVESVVKECTDEACLAEYAEMIKDEAFLKEHINEVAPEGWEGTVKAMKKHKDITNPWALAWYMKNKGYTPHKSESVEEKTMDEKGKEKWMQKAFSKHKGALHKALGVPEDEVISVEKMRQAYHSKDPEIKKMAIAAVNANPDKYGSIKDSVSEAEAVPTKDDNPKPTNPPVSGEKTPEKEPKKEEEPIQQEEPKSVGEPQNQITQLDDPTKDQPKEKKEPITDGKVPTDLGKDQEGIIKDLLEKYGLNEEDGASIEPPAEPAPVSSEPPASVAEPAPAVEPEKPVPQTADDTKTIQLIADGLTRFILNDRDNAFKSFNAVEQGSIVKLPIPAGQYNEVFGDLFRKVHKLVTGIIQDANTPKGVSESKQPQEITELAKDRTFKITTYSFDELSPEAQEHALEKLADINVDYEWYQPLLDEIKSELADIGYPDVEIEFSGFSSQGAGASFTTKGDIDLKKLGKANKVIGALVRKIKGEDLENVHASVERISRQYSHANTVRGNVYYDGDDKTIDQVLNQLEEELTKDVRQRSNDIYQRLEKEYMYLTSKEGILDTIRANDYEFTKDGDLFSGVEGGKEVGESHRVILKVKGVKMIREVKNYHKGRVTSNVKPLAERLLEKFGLVNEMKRKPVADVKDAGEARVIAQEWQRWQSGKSLSYGELADWSAYFTELVKKFPELKDEFKENGII